jgi:hypothetical protein
MAYSRTISYIKNLIPTTLIGQGNGKGKGNLFSEPLSESLSLFSSSTSSLSADSTDPSSNGKGRGNRDLADH